MSETSENDDVQRAAETANKGEPAKDVRQWLHTSKYATLATLSVRKSLAGFPLGSVVPFAVDRQGRPVILIANIAAHTKNLRGDSRAALFVHDPEATGDPQASWRASVMGRFHKLVPARERAEGKTLAEGDEAISDAEWDQIMARYTQRVPQAPGYMKMHGFSFWRMSTIESIRYIAGFGRICWIGGETYRQSVDAQAFPKMEQGAMHHMNEDHAENMKEMCQGLLGQTPEAVSMVDLDISGCILETKEPAGMHYMRFDTLVQGRSDYKTQIISLLRQARSMTAGPTSAD